MNETSSKIMDSSNKMVLPARTPTSGRQHIIPQLKFAPKWIKRQCGVSFGLSVVKQKHKLSFN